MRMVSDGKKSLEERWTVMAPSQPIAPAILRQASPATRDTLLKIRYGISPDEIAGLRSGSADVEDAARLLYKAGGSPIVTAFNIAALLEPQWDDPSKVERRIRSLIERRYAHERSDLERNLNMPVPSIYCLLDAIGGYDGNLPEAQVTWGDLEPSREDWRRSITIPLAFSEEVLTLTGILKGEAVTRVRPVENHSDFERAYLFLSGHKQDKQFYELTVEPLLWRVFHYPVRHEMSVGEKIIEKQSWLRSGYHLSVHPSIMMHSNVIPRWLMAHAKMPTSNPRRFVSIAEDAAGCIAELRGLLATGGTLDLRGGSPTYQLADESIDYLGDIQTHAQRLGFSPTYMRDRKNDRLPMLAFLSDDARRLIEDGYLCLNPRHIKQATRR